MSLPVWPGYCFDRNLGNTHRHRIQILDTRAGIPYAYNDDKLLVHKVSPYKTEITDFGVPKGPSWLVNDKKVLSFEGYWLEGVSEDIREKYRSRNCIVLFYLEDSTIQVLEPRMKNSSLAQGTVVKRRKMLKPPPYDTEFYTIDDLNIGEILYLCGRCIRLTSCDRFTHNYLRRIGVKIPYPIQRYSDPVQTAKDNIIERQRKGKGYYHSSDNLGQFLDHNRQILRFYCFWDNVDLHNDPRSMILYYYLEDDTIEITENLHRNCGREGKLFLRRQKLPKNILTDGLIFPGHYSDPSYLNVIRTAKFEHKILDSSQKNEKSFPIYKDCDLSLGNYINVLGRKFMLCDCDEFTKEYYRKKYGITNFRSIDITKYWNNGEVVERFVAPHNGWGSEEDSILNCSSIQPSELVKSSKTYMSIKKTIDDLKILRFLAIIRNPGTKFDKERRFIISFRVEDDLFSINEETHEKPGHSFTLFLNRKKHMKPIRLRKDIYVPEYYFCYDFYIGALIEVKGLVLEVILTDDYTLKYMESHSQKFVYSSLERILIKLRKNLANLKADLEYFFKNQDPNDTGLVNFEVLKLFKSNFASDFLIDQEMVTLARLYKEKKDKIVVEKDRAIAEIRQKLRQQNYMDYHQIKDLWYAVSPDRINLHITKARSILKGLRLPLTDDMLCNLLKLSKNGSEKEVNLCTLLEILDWEKLQPDYFDKIGRHLECLQNVPIIENVKLAQMFPEKTLNIGMILWKNILNDMYNPPQSSKVHPATQRMIQSAHCKHTYD